MARNGTRGADAHDARIEGILDAARRLSRGSGTAFLAFGAVDVALAVVIALTAGGAASDGTGIGRYLALWTLGQAVFLALLGVTARRAARNLGRFRESAILTVAVAAILGVGQVLAHRTVGGALPMLIVSDVVSAAFLLAALASGAWGLRIVGDMKRAMHGTDSRPSRR